MTPLSRMFPGKALATQLRKVERKVSQQGYTRIWSGPDSRMFALSSLEDWAAGSEEERKRVRPASAPGSSWLHGAVNRMPVLD